MLMEQETLLYEAFFQRNASYYLDKLEKERNGQKFSFNFYAFLFGFFWFLYRKMYLAAFLIFTLLLIEGLAEFYFLQFLDNQLATTLITWIMNILIWSITGFTANYLYIRKATAIITKIDNRGLAEQDAVQFAKKKGGTSYIFLLPIILLIISLIVYNNYVSGN